MIDSKGENVGVLSARQRIARERGACLVSYRIDMTSKVWPFLVPATLLISLGALGVCMAFVTHGPFAPYAGTITVLGAASILAGLVLSIFVARPILTHDEYVAALEKGLLLKVDTEESFFAWGAIEDVRWDAERAGVIIRMREGEAMIVAKPFGRAKGDEVAAKLDEVRRKAEFRLL
jgi:hypothetical protein